MIALQNLANVYRLNDEIDIAAKLLKELVEFKEAEDEKNEIDLISIKTDLVGALRELGKFKEAEKIINE